MRPFIREAKPVLIGVDGGADALIELGYRPDVIVVNAGAAQFNQGGPIVMDNDDVAALAAEAPDAKLVAVHFECVSHSTQTRADLRALNLPNVVVPDDGETL